MSSRWLSAILGEVVALNLIARRTVGAVDVQMPISPKYIVCMQKLCAEDDGAQFYFGVTHASACGRFDFNEIVGARERAGGNRRGWIDPAEGFCNDLQDHFFVLRIRN